MAKEEKPLEYEPRSPPPEERKILETKSVVRRIDLEYLKKPAFFRDLRRRLTWIAPLAALGASIPFVAGLGTGEKAFVNGPVSRAHAIFEKDCAACHTKGFFNRVEDAKCQLCHDGPSHPAKPADKARLIDEPRCAQCHLEHRGETILAGVNDGNCTACHANLEKRGQGVTLKSVSITTFSASKHPDLSASARADNRALKLNHWAHVTQKGKKTRNGRVSPYACTECHVPRLDSPKGDFEPVSFDKHCRDCHKEQLEFDVHGVLGESFPAPHTKDSQAIHRYVVETFQKAVAADPSIMQKRILNQLDPITNPAVWVDRMVRDAEQVLFAPGRERCDKCHVIEGTRDGYPDVKPVGEIYGRYIERQVKGEPWLIRGEFSHRAHRPVACTECHKEAAESRQTRQVLLPKIESCLNCHGSSGTHLDRCATCHLYHNKFNEPVKDGRPIEQLRGVRG
jgi:hypothetical protein